MSGEDESGIALMEELMDTVEYQGKPILKWNDVPETFEDPDE